MIRQISDFDKSIYDVILEMINAHDHITITDVAKKANVAPSTITKLAIKLGYNGWTDLKFTLCQRKVISSENYISFGDDSTFKNVNAIQTMLSEHSSDIVYVCAMGEGDYLMNYCLNKLWERGFNARPISGKYGSLDRKKSMMIVFNESGTMLYNIVERAMNLDIPVICFTNNNKSPVAKGSKISVEIDSVKSDYNNYKANMFVPKGLVYLELIFSLYDRENLNKKNQT